MSVIWKTVFLGYWGAGDKGEGSRRVWYRCSFFSLAFFQISTEPLIAWRCDSGATYTDSMRNVYSKESQGTCQTRGGWDFQDGERGHTVLNAWSRNSREHYLEKKPSQQRGQAAGCSRGSLGGTQTARVEDASGKVRIHMWRRIVHYPGD